MDAGEECGEAGTTAEDGVFIAASSSESICWSLGPQWSDCVLVEEGSGTNMRLVVL